MERKYLPTFAELIDRLSICTLKKIYISDNADEYQKEIDNIKHDIDNIIKTTEENIHGNEGYYTQVIKADAIEAMMIIMLSNRVIWENESKARLGGDDQDKLLKFTHSINGIRNTAKNIVSNTMGERKDLKIDCLAANLPTEFGNWDIFKNIKNKL